MRRQLILRNVVCFVADVSPSDFDVSGFAGSLDIGSGENTMRLENVSVTEWERVRLQVLPDRLQLGFKQPAEGELVHRVAESFLARLDDLAPDKPVDFNAAMLFTLDLGDGDPSEKIVNVSSLTESLDGTGGRGGITLVYHDDLSRWWIELSPLPDQDRQWSFDFNRHLRRAPEPGDPRNSIVDWFADVETDLLERFQTICKGGN